MTKEWEKPEDLRRRKPVLWLTMTALFMAMVVVLSMSALSIPVPGGHLYFNDVVIDTAAMLMDPLSAFIACGVGAFLGDLLFYPAPMFVSLITHGLQALVISLLCRKLRMKQLPEDSRAGDGWLCPPRRRRHLPVRAAAWPVGNSGGGGRVDAL